MTTLRPELYVGSDAALPLYGALPTPNNGGTVTLLPGGIEGGQDGIVVTTQTSSTETVLEWTSITGGPALGDIRGISFWLHLSGALAASAMSLRISPNTSTYNGGLFIAIPNTGLRQGWNRIYFRVQQMSNWAQNLPWTNTRDTLKRLRLGISGLSTAAPATVTLGPIWYDKAPRGILCMTADDNRTSFFERAFPVLKEYRLPMTMYTVGGPWDPVNSVNIGTAGTFDARMSEAQLEEMYDSGLVDIGNHTWAHATCTGKTFDVYFEQLLAAADWMRRMGYTRNETHLHLAWVGGQVDDVGRRAAAAVGIRTARGTSGSWLSHVIDRNYEHQELVDRYNTPAYDISDSGTSGQPQLRANTIGRTTSHTTMVPLTGARWTTLNHDFVATPADIPGVNPGRSCSAVGWRDWCRQVAQLRDAGSIEVMTVGECWNRYGI